MNLLKLYFKNDDAIRNELGDLMLHIGILCKIGSENAKFTMTDVLKGINEKLIYRHPHVFGDVKVSGASEVEENWEQLKIRNTMDTKLFLSGVPTPLPAQ